MNDQSSRQTIANERNPRALGWIVGTLCVTQLLTLGLVAVLYDKIAKPDTRTGEIHNVDDEISQIASPKAPMSDGERRITEALAKPFPVAKERRMPMRDAVKLIADAVGQKFRFDEKSMEDAGIDISVEVVLPVGNDSAQQMLETVLRPLLLEWIVDNDRLTIMTIEKARFTTDPRCYDVTELADPVETTAGEPVYDTSEVLRAAHVVFAEDQEDQIAAVGIRGRAVLVANLARRDHALFFEMLQQLRQSVPARMRAENTRRPRRVLVENKVTSDLHEDDGRRLESVQKLLDSPNSVSPSLIASANQFGIELYRRISERTTGNIAVCPLGAYLTLAMLKEGASGETERQIASVMHLPPSADGAEQNVTALLRQLAIVSLAPGNEMVVLNRVCVEQALPLPDAFMQAIKQKYNTEITPLALSASPEQGAGLINNWAQSRLKSGTVELISPREIVENRIDLAFLSLAKFRGRWAHEFDPRKTQAGLFHFENGDRDAIFMKYPADSCSFGECDGIQVLERRSRGMLTSALILLPGSAKGALDTLEATLSPSQLARSLKCVKEQSVDVEIPRFDIQSNMRFEERLERLGMPAAFHPTNDFSKMGRSSWGVRLFRQQCAIRFNEQGAVASAATLAAGGFGRSPKKPPLFRADRPFLVLIREKYTGLILFIARVAEPEGVGRI